MPENLGFSAFAATQAGVNVVGTVQAGGGIAGDCDLAPLTTDPLGVGQTTLRSRSDPTLWAEPVAPVETALLPSYNEALHAARRVDGVVRLGPVLATYQAGSTSHPVSAYGAGSLWIYEEHGPAGATIFRVSLTTGAVLAAVRTPDLTRPFLVADDDGAWLIPAGSFGAVTNVAVYHLSPGSDRVVPVLTLPGYEGGFAAWAVAAGHAIYADFCPRPVDRSTCTLYGLSGPSARPMFHRQSPADLVGAASAVIAPGAVYVRDPTNVVSTSSPPLDDWLVVGVDMSTGGTATDATALLPEFWFGPDGTEQPDAIVVRGAFFVLTTPDSATRGFVEELRL